MTVFGSFDLFSMVVVHTGQTLWIFFFQLFLDVYAASCLWPVLDGSGQFKMAVPAFRWLLQVYYGSC